MNHSKIKELFKIIGGKPTPKEESATESEGIPFVKMKDLGKAHQTACLNSFENYYTDVIAKKNRLNLVRRGSILLPRSGSVALNHRAILGCDAYIVSHICALENKKKLDIDTRYAYEYLCVTGMDSITKKTTGLDAITFEDLGELQIPLPPLAEQCRIAAILDKADAICRKRQEALKLADAFVKSVFLDMFGDPVLNPKGWKIVLLSSCLDDIENGFSPVCEGQARTDDSPAFLKLSAVTYGVYNENENKLFSGDINLCKTLDVHSCDLLMTRKNTYELVGMCAYVFESSANLYLPDLIFRLCTNSRVSKIYLWKLMNDKNFRGRIKNLAGGSSGSMPNISKQRLYDLNIPLPPLPLQNRFAEIVQRVEAHKQRLKSHLAEAEQMKKALQQEFFG